MYRYLWLPILVFCAELQAGEPIKLVIPDFKPYTYIHNSQAAGIGVDAVTPLLKKMGRAFELNHVPNYGRALAELKAQRADGFFLASENQERNSIAVFSHPILVNKWSWFTLEDSASETNMSPKTDLRIGTIINTNTERWLIENGYQVFFRTQDPNKLVSNLLLNRIDAVFIAEAVFKEAIRFYDAHPAIKQVVEVEKPFGVYFSKSFLAKHEGFLSEFNRLAEKQYAVSEQP